MKQINNSNNKANSAQGQRNQTTAMRNAQTKQPVNSIDTSASSTSQQSRSKKLRSSERVLLPLRLFLGITFVYAGIQKLTDPQFFNASATGFIGKQILAFAHGSPIHNFLMSVALPHAVFFGMLVAFGEIAIGIGTLLGLLLRPAAFCGMLLSLMFFLSASWHVYPYFYGADIVFFFAWTPLLLAGPLGSGLPSVDSLFVPQILSQMSPEWRVRLGPVLNFMLGIGNIVENERFPLEELPTQTINKTGGQTSVYNSKVSGYPQRVPQHIISGQGGSGNVYRDTVQQKQANYRGRSATIQRSQASRRNFLWGLVAGGLGMLGITVAGRAILSHPFGGDDTVSPIPQGAATGTVTQSTPTPGTTPTTASSSTEIAKVSAVQPNSAVTFTIPSNSDPGVLIHLNNGKFVAFDATCTHAGCPVQYDSTSQHLLCPCHGAEFDPANAAAVVQGPTNTPLTKVPIHVDNTTGAITLQ